MNNYLIYNDQILKRLTILMFLFICYIQVNAQEAIKDYKQFLATGNYQNQPTLILRKFEASGQLRYLTVNPQTLKTQLIPATQISAKPVSIQEIQTTFKDSPYLKAIQTAQQQSSAMQDAGLIHGFPKEKGVTLTIDLCPSHKPLDRNIFTSLISEFQKIEKPVPVALSITGRFMLTHLDDINWLKSLVATGDIDITWIDHTYNHHYNPKTPLKTNFLLEPGTDLNFEILGTEIAMLQHGLIPSVFFRFPGLVSDAKLVDQILGYGIIPIGSDAWLAKGQQAQTGSIVLIHGNGNEPIGVQDFIKLLQTEKSAVMNKQWLLYDLRESVADEFQK